jgi:hypothetical protein
MAQKAKTAASAPKYSKECFEEQMLTTFLIANLPFQLVENLSFCKLLEIAHPDIDIPNCRCLRQLLDVQHDTAAQAFLDDLGERTKVSLAIDCWSSPNKVAFMAIVAYYVSVDWKYREVLLAFEPLVGAHTGRILARVVEQVLEQFSLTDRLLAKTTDNASNNGTMRETLQQALSSRHNVSWDAEVAKVSCLAHVLNLSAKSLLLSIKVIDDGEHDDGDAGQDLDPNTFLPDMAENDVARTVVKVGTTCLS